MSIGGIGSGHSAQLGQILSTLFSRLDGATGNSNGASTSSSTGASASSASTGTSNNDAVGQLSDEILALLVQLQQSGSGSGDPGGVGSTGATGPSSQSSPIQQLFSAIDTNGDGSISKSEFEGYITQNGGTQQEADAIFSQLDPNGTGSVSQNQLADAVKAGRPHGHHHHHHGGGHELGQAAGDFFSEIDSDGDGSITQQELESFVTQNGGTTAEADQDFAALDPNNTGSISKSQFEQSFQQLSLSSLVGAIQGGSGGTATVSPLVKLVDAIASNAGATSSAGSSSASDPQPVSRREEFRLNLFARLDANGDGTLTQPEVEQAVTGAGGTTAAADALFSQLDPGDTGSVSQQQFLQNLRPQPGGFHDWFSGSATGSSAQDAILALLQNPSTVQTV